jgi:hypothetical protein
VIRGNNVRKHPNNQRNHKNQGSDRIFLPANLWHEFTDRCHCNIFRPPHEFERKETQPINRFIETVGLERNIFLKFQENVPDTQKFILTFPNICA